MKKTFFKKKSAFSLIELSIVLIIIGLLIAGITGGASLIKSSELRSVMGEARGYAVAVNSFYTNYGALPGDYSSAIGNATAGDGDGTIEYYRAASAAGSESASAWVALRTIGAVDSISSAANVEATTQPSFGATSSATAPSSKVKSSGWIFDYRDATADPFTSGGSTVESSPTVQNVVILTGTMSATDPTAGSNASMTAVTASIFAYDALSIDSKIDDGNAGAGKVRGVNPGTGSANTDVPTGADTSSTVKCYYYSSGFVYNTTNASKSCGISYQVDVNS